MKTKENDSHSQFQGKDNKDWQKLARILMKHGGKRVLDCPYNPLRVHEILSDGFLFEPNRIRTKRGEPNHCHTNASRLWLKDHDLQLVTGYALAPDGDWYSHSWAYNAKSNELIETTLRAKKYYGTILSGAGALHFAFDQVPELKDSRNYTSRIIGMLIESTQCFAIVGFSAGLKYMEKLVELGTGDKL